MRIGLNQSQRNAVYKYIKDGYVIIESGRQSGKTQTLCEIVKYWIEHQAINGEYCVIIGGSTRLMLEFRSKIIESLIREHFYYNVKTYPSGVQIEMYSGKILNIVFCGNLSEYFYNKRCGKYSGISISLLVGDELYIDPKWCTHTACAYIQYKDVVSLSYDGIIDNEKLERIRKIMSKKVFDREFGQYM